MVRYTFFYNFNLLVNLDFVIKKHSLLWDCFYLCNILTNDLKTYFNYCRQSPYGYPLIKEHKLIFYPNNTIFDDLMKTVSEKLKLEKPVGVNEEDQLESILVKNGLIAAIQFHHSPVSNFVFEWSL